MLTETVPRDDRVTRPRAVLTALVFVVLSYGLLQTMLVPTIGVLQQDLRTSAAGASWAILSSTLLASAVATPLIGRLADQYGKRRILLWSLGVYLAGTVGAAVAPGIGVLIACRAVQGISLALTPLSFAIIREYLPPARVAFGLALTSGLIGGTAGAGLLTGGLVVDHGSWRWLFVIGSVLILTALVLTAVYVPPDAPHQDTTSAYTSGKGTTSKGTASADTGRRALDVPGALTLAVGLVALLLAVTEGPTWGWFSPAVLGLFSGALVALWLFTAIERRTADPMIDIGLLTHRPLLIAHLAALTLGANQFVFYVLVPKLAQLPSAAHGFGTSVTGAALILLPGTLIILPASWAAPRLEHRYGTGVPLALGLGLAAAGGALLACFHAQRWPVVLSYLVCSAGYGFAMAALPRLVNNASTARQSGSANSVNTVARTVGGAIGSQVGTAVVAGVLIGGTSLPASRGFTTAFAIAAATAAVGAVLVPLGRTRG